MKFHPALLALALLLFVVLACGGLTNKNTRQVNINVNTNTTAANTTTAPSDPGAGDYLTDLYMAKDNGSGKYGDKTESFSPSDRKVYCVAQLKTAKAGTKIKFVWSIVDAGGSKNEKIKDIEYTTGALESKVNGYLTLPQDWPTGRYKVEAYVNGTMDKSIEYTVE